MFEEVVSGLVECVKDDKMILTFGVGGNAANSIHFAAELSGKFEEYEDPLPCICLSENVASITAITNDFSWAVCFERQIRALAKEGDTLIVWSISSSGIYLRPAIAAARNKKANTILVYGYGGNPGADIAWKLGQSFSVKDTALVQEMQLKIIHDVCREVKKRLS